MLNMLNQENKKSLLITNENTVRKDEELKYNFNIENHDEYTNKINLNQCNSNLEYILYVKKDFDSAKKIWQKNFEDFILNEPASKKMGNKHKCDRNQFCDCINLGKYLLEIEMNTLNFHSGTSNKNLISILEKYYYNLGLTLPFELLIDLSKSMIKLLDFQSVRSLIENYITYSKIKNIQTKISTQSYEITNDQYEELNDILIFQVILVQGGFSRAKAKITSGIKDENLKQKFLEYSNSHLIKINTFSH
jgi:hypothetical protein